MRKRLAISDFELEEKQIKVSMKIFFFLVLFKF